MAHGYPNVSGIYSPLQKQAWKKVVNAVHEKGGLICAQLWHCGRTAHPSLLPDQRAPVGPSKITARGETLDSNFNLKQRVEPRQLLQDEIDRIVRDYTEAARSAIQIGFDAVELHAAHGYLPDQFTNDNSNKRDDKYGGSVKNRCRFTLEVLDHIIESVGSDKTGVRFSPCGKFNDMDDSDPRATFTYLIGEADKKRLAYINITEPSTSHQLDDTIHPWISSSSQQVHELEHELNASYWSQNVIKNTPMIVAGGVSTDRAAELVGSGDAEAVAFGRAFIANPDLPYRIKHALELNACDVESLYGGGEKGYIDYPFYGGGTSNDLEFA